MPVIKPPELRSAMTPFPYAVEPDNTIAEARALMDHHGIRHMPVQRDGAIVGMVSDRDLRFAEGVLAQGRARRVTVAEVCAEDPYVVELDEPLDNVLMTMAERHIGSAIVTRKGRLAGVFTAVDACRCLAEHLRQRFPRDDDEVA